MTNKILSRATVFAEIDESHEEVINGETYTVVDAMHVTAVEGVYEQYPADGTTAQPMGDAGLHCSAWLREEFARTNV